MTLASRGVAIAAVCLGGGVAAAAVDGVSVKAGGEIRYRLELRDDFNFKDDAFEDDAVQLLRTQLYVDVGAGTHARLFVQGQDAESFASSSLNQSAAFIDRLDLRQAYVELSSPWEEAPAKLKVGRQELSYGEQRFVGTSNWSNVPRVFDAVKLSYVPSDSVQADAWFSQPVLINRVKPDSSDHEDNFYGLYASIKPLRDHVLDTFLFIRHDLDNELLGEIASHRGQMKEYTAGSRFRGKRGPVDYGLEWAWQFGSRAHEDIRAWAWHNELGYTFAEAPWSPRVGMEYNHGSGDDNSSDGEVGNFDNLYPANHQPYGDIDFASLRNLDHLEVNASAKPGKPVTLIARHHWFFLDTNESAWFNSAQGVIRGPAPNASRTLGQEIDLVVKWQAAKHVETLLGYSHFHAGAFVRDTGAADDANFVYWQTTVKF